MLGFELKIQKIRSTLIDFKQIINVAYCFIIKKVNSTTINCLFFFFRDFESLDQDSNVNTEQLSETNQLTVEENNHQTNNCDNSRKCVIQ